MNRSKSFALISATMIALALGTAQAKDIAACAGYASPIPMRTPQLFGEGVISTGDDEFGGQFSPDSRTLWFSKSVPRFHIDTIFVAP